MAMVLTSPNQLAAASAGSSASSQNGTNLNAMIGALDSANVSGQMNDYLFGLSSAVASNTTMRDATPLPAMPRHRWLRHRASISIPRRRLLRYQQAYQASQGYPDSLDPLDQLLLTLTERPSTMTNVSTSAFYQNAISSMTNLRKQTEKLQTQISTGNMIQNSRDNPWPPRKSRRPPTRWPPPTRPIPAPPRRN
jgi:hypothetical protein